jgi:hypothetical protein
MLQLDQVHEPDHVDRIVSWALRTAPSFRRLVAYVGRPIAWRWDVELPLAI